MASFYDCTGLYLMLPMRLSPPLFAVVPSLSCKGLHCLKLRLCQFLVVFFP